MRVLLSIKPEHVANIFNGSKKFEFRRRIFRRTDVRVVIVYATRPVGMIVGEFDIDCVIMDTPDSIWKVTENSSGISKNYFDQYFDGRDRAYALKIGEVRLYEAPVAPADFSENFTPPQSYLYVNEPDSNPLPVNNQIEMFECK